MCVNRPLPEDPDRCIVSKVIDQNESMKNINNNDRTLEKENYVNQKSTIENNIQIENISRAYPESQIIHNQVQPPLAHNQVQPPLLILPEETMWDVYVTYVHSTMDVCVRILGETTSALFDDLVSNMEMYYSAKTHNSVPIFVPVVGKFYAVCIEDQWHRVEVVNVSSLEKIHAQLEIILPFHTTYDRDRALDSEWSKTYFKSKILISGKNPIMT